MVLSVASMFDEMKLSRSENPCRGNHNNSGELLLHCLVFSPPSKG